MNQKIKALDYSRLLFTDIETVYQYTNFDENHPNYDIWAWKERDKETDGYKTAEENIRLYYKKAPLMAEWGKVVCISVGFVHNEELHIKSFVGEEVEILKEFVNLVKSTGRMIVGHNIIGFDVNFLRKRFFINGLDNYLTEKEGNDVYMKPWLLDDSLFDTMVAWKGSGFTNTSLEELSAVFKIPTSKDLCHGNEVSNLYYSGRLEDLKRYCEKDVAVVANLVRVWKNDSILEPIFREEVLIEEQPILNKIYSSNSFSAENKEELKKLLIQPTEEDKANLKKIILSHYQSKKDKVGEKKAKEKEVNNFIDSL